LDHGADIVNGRCRDDRGIVTIWFLVLTVAVGAMFALVVDGGAILRTRGKAYAAAEAAARAAANQLARADLGVDPTRPVTAVEDARRAAVELVASQRMRLVDIDLTEVDRVIVTVEADAQLQVTSVTGLDRIITVDATASAERRVAP